MGCNHIKTNLFLIKLDVLSIKLTIQDNKSIVLNVRLKLDDVIVHVTCTRASVFNTWYFM